MREATFKHRWPSRCLALGTARGRIAEDGNVPRAFEETSVQTISQHVEWWKRRLTTMSPTEVRERNRESLAQIRVWGPTIQAFIASASEHHAVPVESARLVDETVRDWDDSSLALRLAIVRFVIEILTVTLAAKAAGADQILGQFATKLLAHPHILAIALHGASFADQPNGWSTSDRME